MTHLETAHGKLELPAFLPDATRAVVRTLDAADLEGVGVQGVMVNTLHLSRSPGLSVIEAAGGIHRFMAWNYPIVSDSGGFQAYSFAARSKSLGHVTSKGFSYRYKQGGKSILLTPEDCIEQQFRLGSDVMICLDECTHPDASEEKQRDSVQHTIEWAQRSKEAFNRLLQAVRPSDSRPLLFAVVQGGNDRALRQRCTESLLEIGFDGYGYGGWPIGNQGALVEMVGCTARLLPAGVPKIGLGIGMPENIVAAYRMGYSIFDCTLPTRDARHARLYVYTSKEPEPGSLFEGFYEFLHISDERYVRDTLQIDPGCDCACCRDYSRAYLHHLFKIEDRLAWRLATIHNLRFYSRLFELLRTSDFAPEPEVKAGSYDSS